MQPSEQRQVCDHPMRRVSEGPSFSSLRSALLGSLLLSVSGFGHVRADATSKQTSPEQYGTPLVHLLGAGILDGESLLQEDPVALSSLNNRIYPLSTGVPVTSVGNVENSLPFAGFGALPLCLERGSLEGDCAASQAPAKAADSASAIVLQGFTGPQQAVFLDVAVHQTVAESMEQEDVPLFAVTSGTIRNAQMKERTANYTLVSLEVELDSESCMLLASSEIEVPECSFTFHVSPSALSDILPATFTQEAGTVDASVWSQMLRVRVVPNSVPATGRPEVSFEREGRYHVDVVTFHFDTAVVPLLRFEGTPAGNPKNLLQIEGDFEEAVVLQYTDPVPSEDTGMPLESTMRIIVARECNAGDVLRVILPQAAVQDLAAWLAWQALGGGEQEGGNIGGSMGHAAAAPVAVALATVALLLQGQRIALYMLPLLCQGSGCDASTVMSLQWTLLGGMTTDPTHPVQLSPLSESFPNLSSGRTPQSNVSGVEGDVSHVSMYLVAGEERSDGSVGACNPSGMLCGHRWLGNATDTSSSTEMQTFVSTNVQPSGVLLDPSDVSDSPSGGHMLTADTVARDFDAVSTGAKVSGWRIAMGAVAFIALIVAAASVAWCAWCSRKQHLLQQLRQSASSAAADTDVQVKEQGAVAKPSPGALTPVYATQRQLLWQHLRAAMHVFAALAPVATIAAAVGVSAGGAVQGASGGGITIAVLTAVVFAALLAMLAVFYTASHRAGAVGSSFSDAWGGSAAHGGTAPRFMSDHHNTAATGQRGDLKRGSRAQDAVEVPVSRPHSNQKSGNSDTADEDTFAVHPAPAPAAAAASGAYPAQKPSKRGLVAAAARAGKALAIRRVLRVGDGRDGSANAAAAERAHAADLERFCEPCGGELVTVKVGDFGGGAVLDASELVASPEGLQVRTNMGPAMRAAEILTAANLKFVQLLRDKRLPPQPHAMALRAANIIALSSEVIRSNTSEGEICHASLKALQVLLERTTPSANSLIRRLPPEVPPHGHIVLLVDYINNPDAVHPAGALRNWHNPHTTTTDSLQSSTVIPGGQSGMSGDLRTSEVLFALDSASGPAPAGAFSFPHSDGAATLSDHNTMTDSVALSAAVPSTHMPGARVSASQIPENVEIWNDDPQVLSASSMPMMLSNAYGSASKAGPHTGPIGGAIGQFHWKPPSIGPSSAASISTHAPVPTSIGVSTNHSGNARAPSADGSTGNVKEILRPPLSTETNESRAPVRSASGRTSVGEPLFGFPLGPGSLTPGSGSTYGATGGGQPPLGPSSMGPLGTPTDGPSSLQTSLMQASPGHSNTAVATKATGSSSATAAAGSATASVQANAGSFTTQASGTMVPQSGQSNPAAPLSFTTQASGTMAPQSGQSNPAAPPNVSSFMPSTNDTWKGLLPSTQGSTVPAGPTSDVSIPYPSSGAQLRRPYSAGSLHGAVAETPRSSAQLPFFTANETLHNTQTTHNSDSLSGTPLRSSRLSEGGLPSTYTRDTQDARHTRQSQSETPRQKPTPRTPDTQASPIPSTGRYSQNTPRTIFETAASSMYRTTGDHQSAALIAEQLDTIAKSTDVTLACEPNTPRASAFDQRGATNSHVEPPSPIYSNSATSSNLYAVVTPAGQLTSRTNDSSATPHPTGPSTTSSWPGAALPSPQRAATAFETELAAKELIDQYGYYPESPSAGTATERTHIADAGNQRWLMLSTEFDTPHGLAEASPRRSQGDASSTTSLQSSAQGGSSRARSTQRHNHFTRSPSQRTATGGLPTGPRSAPWSGPRSGPRSGPWSGPRSGPRSGPGSYPDALMIQQLRDEFQITDAYETIPVSAPRPSSVTLATSPARLEVPEPVGSGNGPPEYESLDYARPLIGAGQLSTMGGTSGSLPDQNGRTITLSESQQLPVEDVSRQNSGRTGPNYWSDAAPEASLMHMNVASGIRPDGTPGDTYEGNSTTSVAAAAGAAPGGSYPQPCFPTPQSPGGSRGLLLFPKFSGSKELTNASTTQNGHTDPDRIMHSHSLDSHGSTTQSMSIALRVPHNDQEGATVQRSGLSVVQTRGHRTSAFAEARSGTTESYSVAESTGKLATEDQKGAVSTATLDGALVGQYAAAAQPQAPLRSQGDEFEVQRELTAAAALLQPAEVAGNSLEGDAADDAHRFSWWTLEYIGNSRDSSTPAHQLGTLNSAAAASAATETMSEDAFAALQWQRSSGSGPWWAARELDLAKPARRVVHQQSLTARTQDSFDPALHAGALLTAEHPTSDSRAADCAGCANALDTCQSSVQGDGEHVLQSLGPTPETTAAASAVQPPHPSDATNASRSIGLTAPQVGRAGPSHSRSVQRSKQFTLPQYSTDSSSTPSDGTYNKLEASIDKRVAEKQQTSGVPAPNMVPSAPGTSMHSTPRDQPSSSEGPAMAKQFYATAASANAASAAAALAHSGYTRGTPRSPMPPHYAASLSSIDSKGTFTRTPRVPEDVAWQLTQASQNSMALSELTSVGALSPHAYAAVRDFQVTSARQEHIAAVAAHQQHNLPSNRSQSSLSTLPSQPYNMQARSLNSGDDVDDPHHKITAALQKFQMTHMGFPFLRETPQAGTESLADSSIVRGSVDSAPSTRYSWSAHDTLGGHMSPTRRSNTSDARGSVQGQLSLQGVYGVQQHPHSGQSAEQTAENFAMQLRMAAGASIGGAGASQIPVVSSSQQSRATAAAGSTAAPGVTAAQMYYAANAAHANAMHQQPSALPSAPAQRTAPRAAYSAHSSPEQRDQEAARAMLTSHSIPSTGIKRPQKQAVAKQPMRDHLEAASSEFEGQTKRRIKSRRAGAGPSDSMRNEGPSAPPSQLPTASKRSTRKRQSQPVAESRIVSQRTTFPVLGTKVNFCAESSPVKLAVTRSTGAAGPVCESRDPRRESLVSNASSLSHDGTSAFRPQASSITDSVLRPESSHVPLDAPMPLAPGHSLASSDRSPYNGCFAQGFNTEPHSGILDSSDAATAHGGYSMNYRPMHGHHASGGLRSSYQGAQSSSMNSHVVVDPRSRGPHSHYVHSTSVTQSPVTQERSAYPTHTTQTSGPPSSGSQQQYVELQQASAALRFVQTPTCTTPPPTNSLSHHGATVALVTDAVRTVWLAFILPLLSIQPILRYSLAFAAILVSSLVTVVAIRSPRSPYQLGLLLEGISVVVAAAWLLSEDPEDSEPWCNSPGCMAPIIALWTLMLALYGVYLVFVMVQCFSLKPSSLLTSSGKGALLVTNAEPSNSANGDFSQGSLHKHSPGSSGQNRKNPDLNPERSAASIASSTGTDSSDACMPLSHSHVSHGRSGMSFNTTCTPLSQSGGVHGSDAPVSGYQSAPVGSFHASSMHDTDYSLTQTRPSSERRDSVHHSPVQPPVDTSDTVENAPVPPTPAAASVEQHNNDLEPDAVRYSQDKQAMNTMVSSTGGVSASLRFNSLLRAQNIQGPQQPRQPVSSDANAPSSGGGVTATGSDAPVYMPQSICSTADSVARAASFVDHENETSAAPAASEKAKLSNQGSMLSTESTVGALMLPVAPLGGAQAVGKDLSELQKESLQGSTELDEPEGPSASANASGLISESGWASAGPSNSGMTSLEGNTRPTSKLANSAANPVPPGTTGAGAFCRLPSESISLLGLTMQSTPSAAPQSPSTLAHGTHSGSVALSTAPSTLRPSRLSAGKLTAGPAAALAAGGATAAPAPPTTGPHAPRDPAPRNPTASSNPSTAYPSPRAEAPVASEMHEPQASGASKFSLANSEDLFTIPFPKEVEPPKATK